jgi:hypothetical protein
MTVYIFVWVSIENIGNPDNSNEGILKYFFLNGCCTAIIKWIYAVLLDGLKGRGNIIA